MICKTATKQDRLANRIISDLSSMILLARKGMSSDKMIKSGMDYATLNAIINFGIAQGAFKNDYSIKDWVEDTNDFFDVLPPYNILSAIYNQLQKYSQGSIRGYK
jgi:hypothetical protein